jgi:hypothetical protein
LGLLSNSGGSTWLGEKKWRRLVLASWQRCSTRDNQPDGERSRAGAEQN